MIGLKIIKIEFVMINLVFYILAFAFAFYLSIGWAGLAMAIAMLIGLIFMHESNYQSLKKLKIAPAIILVGSGFWNAFIYGVQNLSDIWGIMGLASGVTMIITAIYTCDLFSKSPYKSNKIIKTLVTTALSFFFLLYSIGIYNLTIN